MEDQKTFKQYCKEAKKRLKNGFWQDYRVKLEQELQRAKEAGVSESKVKDYYAYKVSGEIKRTDKAKKSFTPRSKRFSIPRAKFRMRSADLRIKNISLRFLTTKSRDTVWNYPNDT